MSWVTALEADLHCTTSAQYLPHAHTRYSFVCIALTVFVAQATFAAKRYRWSATELEGLGHERQEGAYGTSENLCLRPGPPKAAASRAAHRSSDLRRGCAPALGSTQVWRGRLGERSAAAPAHGRLDRRLRRRRAGRREGFVLRRELLAICLAAVCIKCQRAAQTQTMESQAAGHASAAPQMARREPGVAWYIVSTARVDIH